MIKYLFLIIILFPLHFLIKYFFYVLNLNLVFRGRKLKQEFNKNKLETFFKNYNNQNVEIDNFKLRSCSDYIDCFYIKNLDNEHKNITIYFHGNRGNIYDCIYRNDIKQILKFSNLFLFDYKGYGNSTGFSDEHSIKHDSSIAYSFVKAVLNYNEENIIIYGDSLGSFLSANMILHLKKFNLKLPKLLIMQSPFYSLYDMCVEYYPYLKYLIQFEFSNSKLIKLIKNDIKIIILHSPSDDYIHINHSEKLLAENKEGLVKFYKINGLHSLPFYDDTIIEKIKIDYNN
jgi:hypothetical protein